MIETPPKSSTFRKSYRSDDGQKRRFQENAAKVVIGNGSCLRATLVHSAACSGSLQYSSHAPKWNLRAAVMTFRNASGRGEVWPAEKRHGQTVNLPLWSVSMTACTHIEVKEESILAGGLVDHFEHVLRRR